MKVLPGIGDVPSPPFLPVDFVKRTVGNVTSFDAGAAALSTLVLHHHQRAGAQVALPFAGPRGGSCA